MIKRQKPIKWLHKYVEIKALFAKNLNRRKKLAEKSVIHSTIERRYLQRHQMLRLLVTNQTWPPTESGGFWRAMRWGGAGFLAAQALHYFLPR